MPTESPTESTSSFGHFPQLRALPWWAPWSWLKKGGQDFIRAPGIGLFFGACFVGMGWALMAAFRNASAWVLGLSAGFLLLGPLLCMGLYQVSHALERGTKPQWDDAVSAWHQHAGTLAIFGVVLLILEMLWARASLVVFAIALPGTMPELNGSLLSLMEPKNLDFVLMWIALGGVFATIIFAMCAVSIPMILHQGTDAITAALTSIRLVLEQPFVLIQWGALITVLVVLAMLPGFAGLLVVGPVLGHASWHAYRAAVVPPQMISHKQ